MKNWCAILAIFISYTGSSQSTYLHIDKSQNIGLDTLDNGKVVIWFDVYGARDIKRKHEQLIAVKETNNMLREQKYILKSMLDSCEKQRSNTIIVRDTVIKTVQVIDERYKGALIEKELQRRRALHFERKSKQKTWAIIGLAILTILGIAT
jgi:hypothetical protein